MLTEPHSYLAQSVLEMNLALLVVDVDSCRYGHHSANQGNEMIPMIDTQSFVAVANK